MLRNKSKFEQRIEETFRRRRRNTQRSTFAKHFCEINSCKKNSGARSTQKVPLTVTLAQWSDISLCTRVRDSARAKTHVSCLSVRVLFLFTALLFCCLSRVSLSRVLDALSFFSGLLISVSLVRSSIPSGALALFRVFDILSCVHRFLSVCLVSVPCCTIHSICLLHVFIVVWRTTWHI